jgi:hypothetical protein
LKKIALLLATVLGFAVCVPSGARADIGVISMSGSFTGRSSSTFAPLTSQTSCTVTLSGNGQNFRIFPMLTNDGSRSSSPMIAIGGGMLTANGSYTGSLAKNPTILGTGLSLMQDSGEMTGTVNYVVTCTATNYFGALRISAVTLVPADASASTAVTYATPFATSVSAVTLTPSNYSGSDNAAISCRAIGNPTLTGFSASCAGGQSGSTVTLNYVANGQ